ncbi:hypothetical protein AB5I41_07655 [Sphingomonas sp. MMS24-JH45]
MEDDYMIAREMATISRAAIVAGPVPSVAKALELLASGSAIDAAVLDVTWAARPASPSRGTRGARHPVPVFDRLQFGGHPGAVAARARDIEIIEHDVDRQPFTSGRRA